MIVYFTILKCTVKNSKVQYSSVLYSLVGERIVISRSTKGSVNLFDSDPCQVKEKKERNNSLRRC